jgi:predicted CoA-substrate-specific enzyme activase
MITGGIDIGIESIKAVVLKDGQVISRSTASSGGADRGAAAEKAWQEALKLARIKAADVSKVVATGQGKYDARFANERVVEPVAAAKAARFLYPSARAVVDVGADQVRVVIMDASGKITENVLNQKCAAGIGIFLRSIARRLGISLEEMSSMKGKASGKVLVNDCCAVFAELDSIALLQDDTPVQDIVQAIHEAMATRINSVLNDKVVPEKNTTVLVGGVANNQGVVKALKKCSGIKFMIPDQPEYACALGAALLGTILKSIKE